MMLKGIEELQKFLIERGETLSTAESCTGGNIARQITSVSGSSNYFIGSIVAYSNLVKENILGVSSIDIDKHGAVSEVVAIQMAEGVREKLKTDYSVSTTGIAGPTGGSVEKPVGTVWIGLSSSGKSLAKKFLFSGSRNEVVNQATQKAIELVLSLGKTSKMGVR